MGHSAVGVGGGTGLPPGVSTGDMLYYDAVNQEWVVLPVGSTDNAMQLELGTNPAAIQESLFSTFGGNGAQGAVTISADTDWSDVCGAGASGQFTSLTIDNGYTLDVDTKRAYIAVQGTFTLHGTLSAYGGAYGANPGQYPTPGTKGNQNTNSGRYGLDSLGVQSVTAVTHCWAGGGGGANEGGTLNSGGGAGGAGGTGAAAGGTVNTSGAEYVDLVAALNSGKVTSGSYSIRDVLNAGGGGSSATCHPSEGVNSGGGGVIYVECDTFVFDGDLDARGTDGTYIPNGRSIGGGGGGLIIVRTKNYTTSTGTISVTGGAAGGSGYGGSSGAGGDGQGMVVVGKETVPVWVAP